MTPKMQTMEWLTKQVSIYKCPADNTGRLATYRQILCTEFAMDHEWYFKAYNPERWISGVFNDLETIIDLRTREMTKEEKIMLKQTMQCFTPAASLKTKKKGFVEEIERTGHIQIDFDYADIREFDLEELKLAFFDLPFVALAQKSCSGNGFWGLIQISEPDRLADYTEHCFEVLEKYGVPADTSKGRNVQDLRFVSYDCNVLIRENPQPLKIKAFKKKKAPVVKINTSSVPTSNNEVIDRCLRLIANCQEGERWATVQKASYTLGGLNDDSVLQQIYRVIKAGTQFTGLEDKYCECAKVCFNDGKMKPLNQNIA